MTTYRASGILLGDETVTGSVSDITDGLIQAQLSGIGSSDRPMARRAIAVAVAQAMQEEILTAAAKAGRLDSKNMTTEQMARLNRSKALNDDLGRWSSPVPLVLVALEEEWVNPGSGARVIDPSSDSKFVISLMLTTWLEVKRIG